MLILSEFLDKLFNRYICNAENKADKREEYERVLYKIRQKIDFQKLLDIVSKEHHKDFIPPPADILEWSQRCYLKELKASSGEWMHPKVSYTDEQGRKIIKSTDCFPLSTTVEQILQTYEKMFPNCKDWKVLAVL